MYISSEFRKEMFYYASETFSGGNLGQDFPEAFCLGLLA